MMRRAECFIQVVIDISVILVRRETRGKDRSQKGFHEKEVHSFANIYYLYDSNGVD